MATAARNAYYFSFFMFTADLRPADATYREAIIRHIDRITQLGYTGFDLPIAPQDTQDHAREIASYVELKRAIDAAGFSSIGFTTNVAATARFDPSSKDAEQRQAALAYLKSRVDITAALGGDIMAGPIVFPYNVFPLTEAGGPLWSNELHEWTVAGYENAAPVLDELGNYAQQQGVRLAIEPVDHWETPAPNTVGEVMDFLDRVTSRQVGVCVDIAHAMLSGGGPASFRSDIDRAANTGRLNYVHVSAPDRGAVHDSWIPWRHFLAPILSRYEGPLLIETFNAIPVFHAPLRLTRRKFWIPEEDPADVTTPDAYTIAREALAAVRREIHQLQTAAAVGEAQASV